MKNKMKWIKKFESNISEEEANSILDNYSEIKNNLTDLLYDFKDLGCECYFLKDDGADGKLYTITLRIFPPHYSDRIYDSFRKGSQYANGFVGNDFLKKSKSFLENQSQYNTLFKDLIVTLNNQYAGKISFIDMNNSHYSIGINIH